MTDEITLVFQEQDGNQTCVGYSREGTLSGGKTTSTTEDALASVFEAAKSNGVSTLSGTEMSIDEAIDDPLSFNDYLVLVDSTIEFNATHARKA